MSGRCLKSATSPETQSVVRPYLLRIGLGLAILTALTAFAVRASAQSTSVGKAMELRPVARTTPTLAVTASVPLGPPVVSPVTARPATFFTPVPCAAHEELSYKATFGIIPAGTARMRVDGIDMVRGHAAYHVVFSIDGGVPFFRVKDRYESWIDVQTLASLRHRQVISEGRYHRNTT